MCSTGAAIKLTVAPAITPAMAWPMVGNLLVSCPFDPAPSNESRVGLRANIAGLEKTFSWRIRR